MMNAIGKTMKRINRISRKLSLLNSPPHSNNTNLIPHDMLTEILARVASSSAADLYNFKRTCKDFNKAGDDKLVYRHVSMEDFQVVSWRPSDVVSSFLKRCEENENPEALYRRGMVEYFSHEQLQDGRVLLHKAANLGHTAATYVLGMILLLEDRDQSIRDQGMKLLSKITLDSKQRSRIIRDCRKKSEKILRQIWINDNSHHPQELPICSCNKQYQKREGWSSDEESEEFFDCEACKWNHEFTRFYKMLKGN